MPRQIDVKGNGDCLPNTGILVLFDYCYQTYIVGAKKFSDEDKKFKVFLDLISDDKKKPLTFNDFLKIVDDTAKLPDPVPIDDRPYKIQEKYSQKMRELIGTLRADPKYQAIRQTEVEGLREHYRECIQNYARKQDPNSDVFNNNDYSQLFIQALNDLKWDTVDWDKLTKAQQDKLEQKLNELVENQFEKQIYNNLVNKAKTPGTWLGDMEFRYLAKYFGIHINISYQPLGSAVINPNVFIYGTTAPALKWPDKDPDKLNDDETNNLLTILRKNNIVGKNRSEFSEASIPQINNALTELYNQQYPKFLFAYNWLLQVRDQINKAYTAQVVNLGSAHWNYLQDDTHAWNLANSNKSTISPSTITPAHTTSSKTYTANFTPAELAYAQKAADANGWTIKRGTSGAPELQFYTQDADGKDVLLFKDLRTEIKTAAGKKPYEEFEAAAKYAAQKAGFKEVKITAANDEDLVKCRTIAEKYGLVVTAEELDPNATKAPPAAPSNMPSNFPNLFGN